MKSLGTKRDSEGQAAARKAKRAARPPKGEGRRNKRKSYATRGQAIINKKRRAAKRAKSLAKRANEMREVRAARAAGKHAQRHGLFVQAALINGGMPAMEAAQAARGACEKCKAVAGG